MRVYLPSTIPLLAAALRSGELAAESATGHAVTPALREWYASGDQEELEYAAMAAAAKASLRLLAADPQAPPRRVVIAVEVAEARVEMRGDGIADERRTVVELTTAVPTSKIAAGHVDDTDAADDVRAAIAALPAADAGDEDAQFTVDCAEGHELLWYATQELADLLP